MNTEGLAKRARDPLEQQASDEGYTKEKKPAAINKHKKGLRSLIFAMAVPLTAGIIDSYFNSPNQAFYKDLKKPWWNPPNWLFGFMWSLLYPVMGLASWLVWVEGGWHRQAFPLMGYLLQLGLNLAWPAIFFGMHNVTLALVDILALVVVVAFCIAAFKPANHVASNLLKPYLAWIMFAAALNYSIWMKNRGSGPLPPVELVKDI